MKSLNHSFKIIAQIVLLLSVSSVLNAVEWPGSGDCSGTLQACIDAQPDPGIVSIITDTVITESEIQIFKGFRLNAGLTYHPTFRNTHISLFAADNKNITIKGLNFEGNSYITGSSHSDSTINILANKWSLPDSDLDKVEGIQLQGSVGAGLETTISIIGNDIIGEGENNAQGFIDVASYGDGLTKANIFENHVTVLDFAYNSFAYFPAIYVHKVQSGRMTTAIVANEIRSGTIGIFYNGGNSATAGSDNIGIVSNLITGVIDRNSRVTQTNNHTGIEFRYQNGSISGIIGNNTIDGVKRTSGSDGIGFDFQELTTTGSVGLSIFNNILVNTAMGYIGPTTGSATSVTSAGNNFFSNHGSVSGLTLVGNDNNIAPLFIEEGINYALTSTSPGIDYADNTFTSLLEFTGILADIPKIDADGLRRIRGPATDVGAYEWGSRNVFVRSNGLGANNTPSNDSILDNDANAMPILSQIWGYQNTGGVYNSHPMGLYRSAGKWRLFNQDGGAIPTNAQFNVFHPYGESSDTFNNLFHYFNPSSSDSGFELDDFFLNDNSTAMIFASNYWSGVYNPSSLEVGYKNNGKWYIGNVDESDMPTNSEIFVYSQDASRNVFRHFGTAENTVFHITTIDHPLLNGNSCAMPTIMQTTSWFFGPLFGQNPSNISVFYNNERWRIFNQDITAIDIDIGSISAGGVFNVLIDPQQIYICEDIIFKNGFE